MTEAEITAEIDALGAAARARIEAATDTYRGLLPTEIDWMTSEERARLHELQLMLPRTSRAEARRRVAAKRAARKALAEGIDPSVFLS